MDCFSFPSPEAEIAGKLALLDLWTKVYPLTCNHDAYDALQLINLADPLERGSELNLIAFEYLSALVARREFDATHHAGSTAYDGSILPRSSMTDQRHILRQYRRRLIMTVHLVFALLRPRELTSAASFSALGNASKVPDASSLLSSPVTNTVKITRQKRLGPSPQPSQDAPLFNTRKV